MAASDELDDLLEALEHFDPSVAAESFDTEASFEALLTAPLEERAGLVAADPQLRTWALSQRFLTNASALWRHDPAEALLQARIGTLIADVLDEETYHPRWVADLRAKAHAFLANSLRILAYFDEAELHFELAERLLRRGVGSGQREARVLSLRASLHVIRGDHEEAGRLLDRAEAHYEATGLRTEVARTRLKRAAILESRGDFRAAAEECASAFAILDATGVPELASLACQNAVYNLLSAGDIVRARSLFSNLPPTEERMVLVQRRWIEAHLLQAEGKLDLAMDAFDDTRARYANEGLPYDVALVALDQAVAAIELGDYERVRVLAREASLLLGEANAPSEAVALLGGLAASLKQGTVSQSVLTAVRKRLADSRPKR